MENTLMPAEVAAELDIGVSTLRKYSLLLEDNGMVFKRTTQNSRKYKESDVITLKRMMKLMKVDNVTVENAAYAVASSISSETDKSVDSTVIHNDRELHNDDMAGVTLNEIRELKDTIKQQTDTIEEFRVAQEKRDAYFVKILEDLNGQIQQLKEQQALPGPEEVTEKEPELESHVDDNVVKRRSIIARIFGR